MNGPPFLDRADAGRRLARELKTRPLINPLVLALPRGGVEVGFEVALALDAPLDVIPARKLGAPRQHELAIGAVAPGAVFINSRLMEELGLSATDLNEVIAEEEREMHRRGTLFRSGRSPLDLSGKTVVLVDDGLATGATAAAAIQSVRQRSPRALTLAVPVGAQETVAMIRPRVDDLVILESPSDFRAVGQWYQVFDQTSDARVIDLLRQASLIHPGTK